MPDPIVSIASSSALEGDYITFLVSLSEPATDAVTVGYQTISGSAERSTDFYGSTNSLQGTVTFAPGEFSKTIRLRVASDTPDERDESFFVRLINPDGASFGTNLHNASAIGWALDNDGVGLNRAMAVSGPVVSEGAGGTAIFTVSLSEAFDTDRSFSFQTHDGSAKAGSDYIARSGTVTFLAGQTEATVEIDLRNDNVAEGVETFSLSVAGAHEVDGATGIAQIMDDDTSLPVLSLEGAASIEGNYLIYTVHLSEPATDAVTVEYNTLSGTAFRGSDIYNSTNGVSGTVTLAPGETTKTITLRAASDSLDELDESLFLQLSNPDGATFGTNIHTPTAIGWALDNDGVGNNRAIEVSDIVVNEAAGGKATFTVSLSQAFDVDRNFAFSTFDGSAKAGTDYVAQSGTVTFRAGQTEAVVEVDLRNDAAGEAAESFGLAVTGAHGVAGATGTARIFDDDTAQPTISIEGAGMLEGGYLVYTLRLSEPAVDAVSVSYTTLAGSATVSADVYGSTNSLQGTVTFAPGESTQSIVLRAASDSGDELDENFVVQLYNPTGASFGGANRSLFSNGWVLDNDGPGLNRTVAVSGSEVREGPGGRVAVFAVELSSPAETDITLRYATVEGTAKAGKDYASRSGNLTFEAGQTRAEIVVPIKNDLLLEGNERFSLRVIPPFPGELSSSAVTAIGSATIIDGTIRGTDGANRLNGTDLADRIEGFGGNDIINGRDGADILVGGSGNDKIYGRDGNDRLVGSGGRDLLDGGAGRDVMSGGNGNDRYIVDSRDVISESRTGGVDTVDARHSMTLGANLENLRLLGSANLRGTGNNLDNELTGNSGRNVLNGGSGHDELVGQGGHDRLVGGGGNDLLLGGSGNDTMLGGAGRDMLRGDAGQDLLYGGADGAQRDVFVFRSEAHSATGSGRDRIFDFRSGVDDIDLRAIDANEDRRGNQVFDFNGRQADDYSVWFVKSGANVIVRGDNDGDARADFEILVAGVSRLTADDFLL